MELWHASTMKMACLQEGMGHHSDDRTETIADCFYALSEVNLVSGRYQEAACGRVGQDQSKFQVFAMRLFFMHVVGLVFLLNLMILILLLNFVLLSGLQVSFLLCYCA